MDICVLVLEPVTDLFKMQPIAFVLNLVLTVQTRKDDLSCVSTEYSSMMMCPFLFSSESR